MTFYSMLGFENNFLDNCGRKQQNKDSSCSSLYVQLSLLCVFISSYSNEVHFVSMGEAKMGSSWKTSPVYYTVILYH